MAYIIQYCTTTESHTVKEVSTLEEASAFIKEETTDETIVDEELNRVFWYEAYDASIGDTPEDWEMVIVTPKYEIRY